MTHSLLPIVIYSTHYCPYCVAAKALLSNKGLAFHEIFVDDHPETREEMVHKSKRRTVPQIFIGETHIGGFDDLVEADRTGVLNKLVQV